MELPQELKKDIGSKNNTFSKDSSNTKNNFTMNLKKRRTNRYQLFFSKIVGGKRSIYIKIAKIKGQDLPWHNHEQEDELFYIVAGNLLMEIEMSFRLL
jgi:uncharacterized cupin superfamily protein